MINKDEKDFLWKKIELRKKKNAIETENDLYQLLNTDIQVSKDDFIKILNSLEYSFKQKLKNGTMKSTTFISIQDKLPEEWLGVKFSVLKAKEKRDNKKPTINNTKDQIKQKLKDKNIDFDEKMKKSDLLKLFENKNILTFHGFNMK
jgi:hypothetical protein